MLKFCSKVSHSAAGKRERKWGRGAQRRKIISGEFLDGGNSTENLQFFKGYAMEKAIPIPFFQLCGKAEYIRAKILPVLKQCSCSATQLGETFSLGAFGSTPMELPQ